jgi:hypothetical protein
MVRRLTAREKLVDEESLRQCIRPVFRDVSPGYDEIRRVPVLISYQGAVTTPTAESAQP